MCLGFDMASSYIEWSKAAATLQKSPALFEKYIVKLTEAASFINKT